MGSRVAYSVIHIHAPTRRELSTRYDFLDLPNGQCLCNQIILLSALSRACRYLSMQCNNSASWRQQVQLRSNCLAQLYGLDNLDNSPCSGSSIKHVSILRISMLKRRLELTRLITSIDDNSMCTYIQNLGYEIYQESAHKQNRPEIEYGQLAALVLALSS
jgi:hypothetical protein